MKDVFIDNCLAGHFANPVNPEYRDLIKWLFEEGALVVTQHLIREYIATAGCSRKPTCLHVIVDYQTRRGRIHKIGKDSLDGYRISPHKRLLSNRADHYHIKAVLLSFRKMVLTNDDNFRKDLESFRSEAVIVGDSPNKFDYRA